MIKERLIRYIEQSIKFNWDIEALSNYREPGYTYKQIAEKIIKIHIFYRDAGLREGDKVAMIGRNSANWCIVYLATVSYGAVIVPILPDFKAEDLTNIINHSDSKLLYVDDKIWESLNIDRMKEIGSVVSLDSFSLITTRDASMKDLYLSVDKRYSEKYPELKPEHISFSEISNDKLAVISYTSGTT